MKMADVNKEERTCLPVDTIRTSVGNQILASFICTLGTFAFGCSLGWFSPVIDDFQMTDGGPLVSPMSEVEISWAGGLLCLGAIVGQPIFNIVAFKKGRKPSVYSSGIPMVVAAVIRIYSKSSLGILASQFLLGVGGAGVLALPPMYVSETCEPRIRGALGSVEMFQYSFGIFMSYLLGAFVSYEMLTALQIIPPLMFMVLALWFMPETPLFRLKKGKREAAEKTIAWLKKIPLDSMGIRIEIHNLARQLRGAEPLEATYQPTQEDLESEMELLQPIKSLHSGSLNKKKEPKRDSSWKILLSSRAAVRGLIICLSLVIIQTIMGFNAIPMYASVVFDAVHLKLSTDMCSIIYAIILMVGSGTGSLMMDYAGRRFLQIGSCFAVGVGETILGIFFYMSTTEYAPDWLAYMALIALSVSVITFNAGSVAVIYVLLSEYFAAEVRDLANIIIMTFMSVCGYVLAQFFSLSIYTFGIANVFFFFAIASYISGVLCFLFLPETKGKTQDEIIQILEHGILYK